MTTDQLIVFAVLLATLGLFVWNRWRYDVVAMLALLAVALTGLVSAEQVFSGFGHPAVITVAAVLVLSRGLMNQDERMLAHIAATLGSLKAMGRLKPETEPETVAFAIYGIMAGGLMWYAMDERTGMEETKERIAAMVGQFCRGIVPEG